MGDRTGSVEVLPKAQLDEIDRWAIGLAEAEERLADELGVEAAPRFVECDYGDGKVIPQQIRETPNKRREYKKRNHRVGAPMCGMRFGRLTVYKEIRRRRRYRRRVMCFCDCGAFVYADLGSLRKGNTRSCGCLSAEATRTRSVKHGMTGCAEFRAWVRMRQVCYNPRHPDFKNFGGKGIAVCEQWQKSFSAFISDMRARPQKAHLARKDVLKHFTPDNCEWAGRAISICRMRGEPLIKLNGIVKSKTAWAQDLHVSPKTVRDRVLRGMTLEEALTSHARRPIVHRRKQLTPARQIFNIGGVPRTRDEWASICKVNADAIARQMRTYGMTFERAVATQEPKTLQKAEAAGRAAEIWKAYHPSRSGTDFICRPHG